MINMKKTGQQKGFTLIELMVVVSILGLMATLTLTALDTTKAKSRNAKRATVVRQYIDALELYRNDHNGYYPLPSVKTMTYCLGNNNNNGNCYNGIRNPDSTLISAINPYFSGPPASNDPAIDSGNDWRGMMYSCNGGYDINNNCFQYTITWFLEAGENKCSGGSPSGVTIGTLFGCQFQSGGKNI